MNQTAPAASVARCPRLHSQQGHAAPEGASHWQCKRQQLPARCPCRVPEPGNYSVYVQVNGSVITNSPYQVAITGNSGLLTAAMLTQSLPCLLGRPDCSGRGLAVDCQCACDEGWLSDLSQMVGDLRQLAEAGAAVCQKYACAIFIYFI
jgi:hypothetical protein